ncbi:MAG: lipopolysaccharide biosynthesis protein [Flavobacteriia bacterium]|jgi:teichuronic acid exporter
MLAKLNIKSEFFKSVLVLTSGTVLAQIISYLLSPIITRLYSPEDVGEFGFYVRIVTLISTIATARYELSLPVPKNENHAFQIFRLTIRITFFTLIATALLGIIYLVYQNFDPTEIFLVLAVLVGTFLMVFYNIGTSWSVRIKSFRSISYSKISSSFSINGLRVLFGFLHWGYVGLIFSFIIGTFISILYFIYHYLVNTKNPHYKRSKGKMKVLSREFKDFPLINLPHALADALREVLLAFIIVHFFSDEIFGSFDHSFRMLKLPLILIGSSIAQVFMNKAISQIHDKKPVYPLVKRILTILILLSIIPFSLIFFFGGDMFAYVFGNEWKLSGELSEIMAIWLMTNFLISPISSLPIILSKQKSFFIISLIGSVLQILSFAILPVIFGKNQHGINTTFWFVSIAQTLINVYTFFFLIKSVKDTDRQNALV